MALKALALAAGVTGVNLIYPLPIVVNLVVFTLVPIYVGSLRSRKLSPWWTEKDPDEEELSVLDQEEAVKFPLVASAVLVSLYLCIKFFGKEIINFLISTYLVLIGAYAVKYYFYLIVKKMQIASNEKIFSKEIKIPVVMKQPQKFELTWQDVLAYFLCFPLLAAYFLTQFWVINNVFGIALAVHALENLPVKNFKILFGLLAALLFYDVFFVFGTDVMLTVAKNIDGPIKLLFPKPIGGFSMIGLGDIIMPGILIAMTIRYDLYRKHKRESDSNLYLFSSLSGYIFGIILTTLAMLLMEKEQPALLYLVPSTIISVLLPALFSGELSHLWLYSEEVLENN
jgi:minor histocompatibility antigen H13